MSTEQPGARPALHLSLNMEDERTKLALAQPAATEEDPALEERAQACADRLLATAAEDHTTREAMREAVEDMGRELQRQASRRSQMLQRPVKELAEHAEDGGPVANALVDLKTEVEALDPARFDLSAGWFSRTLGLIPGMGTPMKRYFSRFESAQTVIDAIIRSLELGRDQLKRDNLTLREDQRVMRELSIKLQRQIALGQRLDQKLQYKLEREVPPEDPRQDFAREELIFPLRQRIMDLQQQLAVNQQGVLATAVVMRNNQELIRGVDRALDVTVSALQVAVTVALGLAHQKIVLDKVGALNRTTSDLIAGTAARLRDQGTAIQTQAAGAMLDMDALKGAFGDIQAALDELSRYRREALPQMAQAIVDFDALAAAGERAIRRMEHGEGARPVLQIEAE